MVAKYRLVPPNTGSSSSTTTTATDLPRVIQIELNLTSVYPECYREVFYTPATLDPTRNLITQIKTWDTPAKALLVFTKTFTFDSQDIVQTATSTYVPTGEKITKTITRTTRGHITAVTRVHI